MLAPDKMSHLLSSKEEKINTLSEKKYSTNNLDQTSYTDLGDGYVENNGNKIWGISDNWTPEENAFARDYLFENYALPTEASGDRRAYQYGVKEEGKYIDPSQPFQPTNYDPVKVGLASGRLPSSDYRYIPGKAKAEGLSNQPYGWESGERGVDVADKRFDQNLAYEAATALEALTHSNKNNLENRLVRERADGYYDYMSPEGLIVIDKDQKNELFGSGASEYYANTQGIFADSYDPEKIDQQKIIAGINKAMQAVAGDKYEVPLPTAAQETETEAGRLADEYTSFGDRAANTAKGFAATFIDSLIVAPAAAIGDLTGAYDLGSGEENTAAVNEFFGYDPRFNQRAMERIGTQWQVVADENASVADRVRAAGNGIIEAFTTPETLGTSLGALASWVTPGAVLKAVGVGSKFANGMKAIDAAVDAGTITANAARLQKASQFLSVPGAQAALAAQSGFLVSALGNVNNQYQEFVENNGGVELEGAEKAQWFAGRYAVQVVNQNIDKLVDFSILKGSPGLIAGAIPAVKAMTNKEFANVAKTMAKGVAVTGTNMGKEAAQEYSQTMMELFNSRYGSKKFEDVDNFVDFITDERNTTEAGIAALAGAGGAGQFETVGAAGQAFAGTVGGLSTLGGKAGEKIKEAKATPVTETPLQESIVVEEDLTPEQVVENVATAETQADSVVGKYSNMLDDTEFTKIFAAETIEEENVVETPNLKAKLAADPAEYRTSIDEIEKAEAVIQSRVDEGKAKDTDELAFKVLRTAKREIYNNLMEEENQPTLGSGISAEDIVEDYLNTVDVVDGELDLKPAEEKILDAFVKKNDIPPLRFTALRKLRTNSKDASVVRDESLGSGERSANSYRNTLRTLVNTPNPSRKAIASVVDSIDNFLNSQENRKAAYDATLNEVRGDVDNYNRLIQQGKTIPAARKKQITKGKDVPGYEGAFVAVSENGDGTLRINENSTAVSTSIQDTIDYLKRTKTRYGSQVNNILGEEFVGSAQGISVRPNSAKQEARDADQAFYEKRGVTKAIVDTKASAQWANGGDYSNDNSTRVNTGEYTEDDVVVVNSTAKGFDKKGKLRAELNKAYKAGAAIVLDREVANNVALQRLVQQYHFKKVTENGVTKYLPEAKAAPIRDKQAAAKKEEKVAERSLKKLIQAIESGDQKTADEIIKERFGGDNRKAQSFYDNQVNKKSKEITDKLLDIALSKGFNSPELADAMTTATNSAKKGDLPTTAVDNAFKAVTDKVEELQKGEQLLSDWNKAQQEAKKGKLDFNEWVKANVPNPMKVVKDLLANSIGQGRKAVYAYFDEKKGFILKTRLNQLPEGVSYQVLELDPNTYTQVNKVTPINTFNAKELRIAGQDNIAFNQLVSTAVSLLEKTLRKPNLVYKNSNNSIVDLANSPVSSLIFDKDLNISENVAIAAHLGLHNFIKNSAYLLKKGKKSKADIAEILGIDESQLSREAVDLMSDKGLLYKTAANSIGKDIAGMLGLARKSDSEADAQAYDSLVADLGQTALLMGVAEGVLEIDNSVKATEFAKVVQQKAAHTVDDGNNAKVIFIQVKKGQEDTLTEMAAQAKTISEAIPDVDVGRKEPSFTKPSDKIKNKIVSKIRKEKLGLKIAQSSQKALKELMDTEWTADLSLMRDMIENKDLIKARLGYIEVPSNTYESLSFEEKEVQESINRGLDKSFEEMEWLVNSNKGDNVSLWFEYFFSKNGRFFVDSNTINPQTDKHLHRFTVQPKSHKNTFVKKGSKFMVGKEDVTANVHYALSQAFGFATDKKDTAKIKSNAEAILKKLKTKKDIAEAKEEFLKTGEVKSLGVEIEHLGHALQAFKFLDAMVDAKGKPFDSAITAEFDAVTSGFGLKNLQMPIISGINNWLKKVGVILNTDEVLTEDQIVSMNDILDSGNVLDSYQTLASDVQQLEFEDMQAELGKYTVVSDSNYSRNLWDALSDVLPQVEEGKVSSALRNLFKYPFMTFNYSASIKSIRKNLLTGELLTGIAKQMAQADLKEDSPIVGLMRAFVGDKGDIAKLQNDIRTKPMSKIRSSAGVKSTLEQHLGQMIEASYGAQVEKILTEQFGPFVDAQNKVNTAFKAMFEVFSVSFEKKLEEARKKGPVSVAKEREIYNDLKAQWPMIKGPLSNMEEELEAGDGIGIYDTTTSSPYGNYAGRKPARANLSKELEEALGQKEVRVSQMIKQMAAAIAAGSVVPIHYIDGAIMAQTINSLAEANVKGITSIHDAIMPPLTKMSEAQQAYNKQTLEVNASYSFINEIMTSLDRFLEEVPLTDKAYAQRKVADTIDGERVEIPVKDYLLAARNNFASLVNQVNEGRELLYSKLNEGAKVMHMAGTAEGVYNVEPGSVTYKPVEKVDLKGYNDNNKISGVARPELDAMAQNICK